MTHKLLERQVKKLKRRSTDGEVELEALLALISETYEEADIERRKKDRSMKLMSDELLALNSQIKAESEAYVSTIMENVVDGIVTFDSEGIIQSFNGPMESLFGLSPATAIGQHISILTPEDPETNDIYQIYRKSQQGSDTLVVESEGLDQQGNIFPIDLSVSEMQGGSGSLYIAIIRDISRRKEFEQALIQAKNRAEEVAIAKTNFLSTMSHEIRTPMNAVIGLTNLLLQESPRPDQVENLEVLKFSGENLLVLINDVLDFNKIEAGKLEIEEIPFRIHHVLNAIREALQVRAKEKGIAHQFQIDPALPQQVMGDSVRLSQILNNLVGNAIKFTEEGNVQLKIEILREEGEYMYVDFAVIDSGIGIPADKIGHIFESFNQSDSSITRKYGGTGLGLAITRRLLELQHSEIRVTSELGSGSSFAFTLKLSRCRETDQLQEQSSTGAELNQSLEGCHVLLVEDNKINQLVAGKFLKNWGMKVDIADNGLIALEKISQIEYDVVLMDLQMPEMDGYSATRAIRKKQEERFQRLPIIALTASAMQPIKTRVKEAGMNDFVSKPFDPVDLNKKLSLHIKRREKQAV